MENNELINSPELEQLKAEYSVLKQKFSHQEVINDRLLRETMRQRVKGINSITFVSSACGLFVIIISPYVFHYNPAVNASWAFVIATIALMLVCIFFNWKYNYKLKNADITSCDLKEFARNVQYTRKKWHDWIRISIPMIIIWFGWLSAEILFHSSQKDTVLGLIISMAIGGLVGGAIGFKMNRKVVSNCDEILEQIDN